MTRNLLVALVGIVSTDPRVQLICVVSIVIFAQFGTATQQPWRVTVLNHYDASTCTVLCLIGMFGVVFLALQEQLVDKHRLGQSAVASVGPRKNGTPKQVPRQHFGSCTDLRPKTYWLE